MYKIKERFHNCVHIFKDETTIERRIKLSENTPKSDIDLLVENKQMFLLEEVKRAKSGPGKTTADGG